MKALLMTLPLVFALNANATSLAPVLHELACSSVDSHADYGTLVNVDYLPTMKSYRLVISAQTIGGPRPISNELAQKLLPKARMMGAPVVYRSASHSLIFNATTSPNQDGSRRGVLSDKNGNQLELNCRFVR